MHRCLDYDDALATAARDGLAVGFHAEDDDWFVGPLDALEQIGCENCETPASTDRLVRAIADLDRDMAALFTLMNDAPRKPAPVRAEVTPQRQRALFSGLDCLAGQTDLFDDLDKHD